MEDGKEKFPNGMIFKRPRENAPAFVKGHVSIKVDEFIPWLETHKKADFWVNLDLLISKEGKPYFKLDTWEPEKKAEGDIAL